MTTTWTDYLDRLEQVLDLAVRCLAAGDPDGATGAVDLLAGREPGEGLPPLPAGLAARANRAARRLTEVEETAQDVLHRLRAELGMLAATAADGPTAALFVDQSA